MEIKKKKSAISWSAAEHHHTEKNSGWYAYVGGAGLFSVMLALFMSNFFFAIVLLFSTILIMVFGSREPQVYDFRVDHRGVTVGHKTFGYDSLVGFAIRKHNHEPREIVIRRKAHVDSYIHLPMERHLIPEVRTILLENLQEARYEESVSDILSDFLGF